MVSRFPSHPQEGPNSSGPSNAVPSGPRPADPGNYEQYVLSEYQNMLSSLSLSGRGPSGMMNDPIVNQFTSSPPYLTSSAFESNDAFPFPPYLHGWQTVTPYYPPMQPPGFPYTDGDNPREIPISAVAGCQEVIPVSSTGYIPPPYQPSGPPAPVPGAQDPTGYASTSSHSESTGDAPGNASPASHPAPQMPSGSYRNFIDDSPVLGTLNNLFKETVGSYPILQASLARRQNPASYVCDICQATFTRAHNRDYHLDAHFGIKNYSSLCGKKFGTPGGSKRHQNTCSKCKGVSSSTPSLG